ncbi:hypothetical protein ACFL2J_00075 [Candidatus Omnitrophota bacterium]
MNKKMGYPKGVKIIAFSGIEAKEMIEKLKQSLNISELISSLAIEIWRLEKRVAVFRDKLDEKLDKDSESIIGQLQRIKDVFKKQGIEIREHTGTFYNDGLSLKVLHVEEVEGIPKGKMRIIETIKPSIYFEEKVIFYGEVIVGKSKEKL